MIQDVILTECKRLIENSPQIAAIAPDIKVFLNDARSIPTFPHVVQKVKLKGDNDLVTRGFYYVDVVINGFDSYLAERIGFFIKLLVTNYIFPGGGGVRMTFDDEETVLIDREIYKHMLMFEIRGSDTEFITQSLLVDRP